MHWCNYMYLLELARFEKEMPTARVWPHGSRWPYAQVWILQTDYIYLIELASNMLRFKEKEMPTACVWPHVSRWPHAQVWISRTDASRHLVSAYTALHNLRINLHVVRPPPLFINGQISPIRRRVASVIEVSRQLLHLTTCAPLQPGSPPLNPCNGGSSFSSSSYVMLCKANQ